ncbi:MAG: DUF2207 domain-containing protein [Deltaproteobacteria bacterium]|nr:DUF2207 domain-containing protein [Deltaproteobacteria bacterium]
MRRLAILLLLVALGGSRAAALSEAECAAARLAAARAGSKVDPCYPGGATDAAAADGEAAATNCDPPTADAAADEGAASDDPAERIRDYHSDIVVDRDGGLTVTETLAVTAAGDKIKHGIYRDFPTLYEGGAWGLRRSVPFEVVAVERDGRPEPYHLGDLENGVRVYIGDADSEVEPGPHTYRLTYRTARQLGFFEDHDELYWNVTGNGWVFPIDRATARVELPPDIPREALVLEGYTGVTGSTDRHLTSAIDARGAATFAATVPLDSYEGLTIVASFPKGHIRPPSDEESFWATVWANPDLLAGAAGLLVVLLYYLATWVVVGRDPARGTIIPLFEPPAGLDAPGVRYVRGMGYDERCFTAGLVGLAVKGWVQIKEHNGEFSLLSVPKRDTPLTAAEKQLNGALFHRGGETLELKQRNHGRLRAAITALRGALSSEYERKLFNTNRRWIVPGLAISALALLVMAWFTRGPGVVAMVFMLIWLSVWSYACLHLLESVLRGWRDALRPGAGAFSRGLGVVAAIIISVIALPFFAGEAMGLYMMSQLTTIWATPLALALGGTNWLFLFLLKQPTRAGRALMDQIDGFAMYLGTAEGDELRMAPPKTPQRFEAMLPYAIALGVEHQWSARFDDVLRSAGDGDDVARYKPGWYSGDSISRFSPTSFSSMVGSSLSSAVASSSTPPGSSSGSSGGGSAGGGGGGGGGGGW